MFSWTSLRKIPLGLLGLEELPTLQITIFDVCRSGNIVAEGSFRLRAVWCLIIAHGVFVFVISDLDIDGKDAKSTDVICDSFEVLKVQPDIAGGINQLNELRLLKMCCQAFVLGYLAFSARIGVHKLVIEAIEHSRSYCRHFLETLNLSRALRSL